MREMEVPLMGSLDRRHLGSGILLILGWTMVAAASVLLLRRYVELPDSIPLYRPPWTDAPILGTKTPLIVARFATMGLGQVGAATVMAISSWRADAWRRFWTWAVTVAGAKTLLECVGLSSDLAQGTLVLTGLVVAGFVTAAILWWRRGQLSHPPKMEPSGVVGVAIFVALWVASAALPLLA
jgi:hypothetical protein